MKKITLIILSVLLAVLPALSAFAAEPFSLDYIRNSQYVTDGTIKLDEEEADYLFVQSSYSAEELAFTHTKESDEYYSWFDFDIIVLEPGTEEELPVLRLWFNLWTNEQFYDVSSVTFTCADHTFTFSELSDPEDYTEKEGQYRQEMLIRFNRSSLLFLSELMRIRSLMKVFPEWKDFTVKTVFHGTEEIETELGTSFWTLFDVFADLYINSNASSMITEVEGTPMEMGNLP